MNNSRTTTLFAFGSCLMIFAAAISLSAQITIKIPRIPKISKEKPAVESESGNGGDAYDKGTFQSIFFDTGYGEFGGYSNYVSPYLNCYARNHGIPEERVDMWPKSYGGTSDEQLALGQKRLADLEAKLKARMRSFPHTGEGPEENPGLVFEIATRRAEYLQCLREGQQAEADEAASASANNMARIFLEELAAARKEVAEYSPSTKIWLISSRNSEWLDRAISKGWRKEFFEKWKFPSATEANFDSQLDAFATEADPMIRAYTASQLAKINLRSPAEERMMMSEMNDIPGIVVHKIGLYQSTWSIEKNSLGIPIRRYKTGAVYGRNPNSDHPYCWFWTVNIRQDYAGGGTYGQSYAKFMDRDIAACPGK